jgi:two-component system phosphate regulon sensor histidine kinase PhoR
MNWIKAAPLLGVLALMAGAVGLLVPDSKNLALIGVLGFGIAALAGWIETARRSEQAQRELVTSRESARILEQQIERHRDALDDLAEGFDASVFLLDTELRILYANSQAEDFFRRGSPEGEVLQAITLSSELDEIAGQVVQELRPITREVVIHHPRERMLQAHCWPEEFGPGRIFLSLRDITELRRLETVRRDFVANVSHELRTPMTTIRAMTETLAEGDTDPELRDRYLEKIISEVDRLTRITDDLLTLSIAESGTQNLVTVDMADLTGGVVTMLEKKAKAKGLLLSIKKERNITVLANETQLSQIIFNLVDNAINYSNEGSVQVTLDTHDESAVLTVQDTGIGISSENLSRIFERFYRVDKGRSRASGGTGLGLAIVKHLVELHNGEVSVESALNRGTTFTVKVPLA